jgi:hypothetical protein
MERGMDEVRSAPVSDWMPLPRAARRTCPLGVVKLIDRFAVLDRRTGTIVEAGFDSFERGWIWIAKRLEGRA